MFSFGLKVSLIIDLWLQVPNISLKFSDLFFELFTDNCAFSNLSSPKISKFEMPIAP